MLNRLQMTEKHMVSWEHENPNNYSLGEQSVGNNSMTRCGVSSLIHR